jgi:hypothetical protein
MELFDQAAIKRDGLLHAYGQVLGCQFPSLGCEDVLEGKLVLNARHGNRAFILFGEIFRLHIGIKLIPKSVLLPCVLFSR